MIRFEGYERRIDGINKAMAEYGIESLEDAVAICQEKGIDVAGIVKGVQPIAFENAVYAYTLGCAIAIKKGIKNASEAAAAIGIGLQAFCIPGSVADARDVGLGHGNLAAMLLSEETKCFCFLAGHESFAAAEGAIGIARTLPHSSLYSRSNGQTQRAHPAPTDTTGRPPGKHLPPRRRIPQRIGNLRRIIHINTK